MLISENTNNQTCNTESLINNTHTQTHTRQQEQKSTMQLVSMLMFTVMQRAIRKKKQRLTFSCNFLHFHVPSSGEFIMESAHVTVLLHPLHTVILIKSFITSSVREE